MVAQYPYKKPNSTMLILDKKNSKIDIRAKVRNLKTKRRICSATWIQKVQKNK